MSMSYGGCIETGDDAQGGDGANPVASGPYIPNDFLGTNNPYGDDQNEFVPQYNKPNPFEKRKNCGEDQPVGGGKDGKYNLNWIDDQNELNAVFKADEAIANHESPIFGMDFETFKDIIDD